MFSFNNNAVAGTSQPAQQQQPGSNQFSSPGPLSVNELNGQQQHPFGQQQPSMFGQQQNYGQQQPQQQQSFGQFGQQPQQPQQPFGQAQQLTNQQQQQLMEQQRQQAQQQMSYVPGYLSRMRGDKPYRSSTAPLEPGSPDASRDADSTTLGTPAKSAKEDMIPSRGQPSPAAKFSSSFFDDRAANTGSWRGGRESIFGAGGLRGGRKSMTPAPAPETPGRDVGDVSFSPGRSFRAATSPPTRYMDDDDDDAPPQERLDDIKPSGTSFSFARQRMSMPIAEEQQQLSGQAAVADKAKRTVLVYGYPSWMEKAVLEIFAAVGSVESIEAIDLTGTGSAQDQAQHNPSGPLLPCCTRVRYDTSMSALHAMRRNGEIVAGACIVGVRWEDENYHQTSLTSGVDAVLRREVHPSSRTAEVFKSSSSKPLVIPAVEGEVARRQGPRPAATTTVAAPTLHSYGRPISVIGDTASALMPVGSPFGSNTTAPSTPAAGGEKKSGMLTRLTDGIFGW